MIIKPRMRGFICTTAHPVGCAKLVRDQIEYAKSKPGGENGPKRVLVIGASTGYGLATRVAAAFGYGAHTVGVFLEKEGSGGKTATAGWYNNREFEAAAAREGRLAFSVCGDAFSEEVKADAIRIIRDKLPGGQVDLIVYSVAAPRRRDPVTGEVYSSVIKPVGAGFRGRSVNPHTGELTDVDVSPAEPEEVAGTVAVMGGADWLLWINALKSAGVLAKGALTVAYTYIGPKMTHSIYKDGTIGKAKEDLEAKAREIEALLSELDGRSYISVNKALVTQSSSAIPVVPLYISMLYSVMKSAGTHEDCIRQMVRLLRRMYPDAGDIPTDEDGRIRMDDWEMNPEVQREIDRRVGILTGENLAGLTDLEGYKTDFYRLFGFAAEGVDYDADVPENLI